MKGNKDAKILEVSNSKKVTAQETPAVKALMERKKELMEKKKLNRHEFRRLSESLALAKKFAESAFQRVENQPPKSVQEAREIMEYHASEDERVGREHIRLDKEHESLNDQINVITNDIDAILGKESNKGGQHTSRIVHIKLLRSPHGEGEDLLLTYMVSDSRWEPSYDMRINSEKKTTVVTYYAEVSQRSGETWDDAEMLLSTSNPSIGSTPQTLPIVVARDYVPIQPQYMKNMRKGGGGMMKKKSTAQAQQMSMAPPPAAPGFARRQIALQDDLDDEDEDEDHSSDAGDGYGEAAKVKSGDSVGTGFTIPRKVTIHSNVSSSKVVISEFTLSPSIVHYTVPSTGDSSVYLQAKTTNTTDLVLLASAKVNVFVDGAFISTSDLKQTSAGSNFYMFLGVDAAVKCCFREVKSANKGATWTNSNNCKGESIIPLSTIRNLGPSRC